MYKCVILQISGLRYIFFFQWDDFVDPPPFPSLLNPHAHRCWMKVETLPAVHQANLAQASRKGALRGSADSTDAGGTELVNALNASSVGVQKAAQGSGVQDRELAEVLLNIQIVPGQPAHKAPIDAILAWTGLEEKVEFATALQQGSHHEWMARYGEQDIRSGYPCGKELNYGQDVESTGAGTGGGGVNAATIVRTTFVFLWPSGTFCPIMWQ